MSRSQLGDSSPRRPTRDVAATSKTASTSQALVESLSLRYTSRGMAKVLPNLDDLHQRHYGLPPELNAVYAVSARVSLARHHAPPAVTFLLTCDDDDSEECVSAWEAPTERQLAGYANRDDATRDGAYAVALAAVELVDGAFAVSRADVREGADYYVAPPSPDGLGDLEDAARLEVSGIDSGGESAIRERLQKKLEQVEAPEVNGPALACVVGFRARRIAVAHLD